MWNSIHGVNLEALSKEIRQCDKCELCNIATQKVVGKGVLNPKIVFIGEAPGAEEDKKGEPFCGPSGTKLNEWINFLGLDESDYSILNLLKCRPPNNASPTREQLDACQDWLMKQLEILKPEIIFCLGSFATKEIIGCTEGITKLAGKVIEKDGIKYVPFPHPSYFLRRGGHGWESDLLKVKQTLFSMVSSPKGGQSYVPLHVHTTYSVTDSCSKLDDLTSKASEMQFRGMAITDHGTIGGWIEFRDECAKNNIKPIFGIEFYLTSSLSEKTKKRYHVVALAKNNQGLRNIMMLNELAQRRGFYYKPRITIDWLREYSDGLIILSACTLGIVSQYIVDDQPETAETIIRELKEVFKDDFYLELQPHDFEEQHKTNASILLLSKKYDVPLVVTSDCHYIEKDDKEYNDVLKAICFHKNLDEVGFSIDTNYLMDASDMREKFKFDVEEAMSNTLKILEKCNAKLESYDEALPEFKRE
jgi:uracil-DNA glycosylase family 4